MSPLRQDLDDYLQMRRDLGFKYRNEARHLKSFISYMERHDAPFITSRLALDWAVTTGGRQPSWKLRLIAVRGFARHMLGKDQRTELPPVDLIRWRTRTKPYLYTEKEIRRLLVATSTLPSKGLSRASFRCLFGLLAVTGLRVGEALRLERSDVNLKDGLLQVRNTKFGKCRIVPIHRSTQRMLALYAQQRDLQLPALRTPYFLVGSYGGKIDYSYACKAFLILSRQIGLRAPGARHGPRIHVFRHRYAVETLLGWYRSGAAPERLLPVLSTYLGHGCVHSTYWYLSACPELMSHAVQRLDKHWEASP